MVWAGTYNLLYKFTSKVLGFVLNFEFVIIEVFRVDIHIHKSPLILLTFSSIVT